MHLRFNKFFLGFFCLFFLNACIQGSKTPTESQSFTPTKGDKAEAITKAGQNRNGRYSPTGQFVIFHSSHRPSHKNSQIYLYDQNKKISKRITYHDGETANAQFTTSDRNIVYASTTDEIKEFPSLLQKTLEGKSLSTKSKEELLLHPTLPYEVYTSRIDGSGIRRLTRHRGYDGSIFWNSRTKRIFFTSLRRNKLQLHSFRTNGRNFRKHLPMQKNVFDANFNNSTQSWTWTQYTDDFQTSKIYISDLNFKNPRVLKLPVGLHWSPRFSPDGKMLFFSSKTPGTTGFNLFAYRIETNCVESITELPGHEFSPDFHPYRNEMIFTYKTSLETQIYKMEIDTKTICRTSPSPRDQNVNL